MNTEKLISKGVKKHFNGQVVLFNVESLKEHFDGLLIHESDIINISESEDEQSVQYVKIGDINFDNAVSKEVIAEELLEEPVMEVLVNAETLELNPELVEAGVVVGETITVDAEEPIEEIVPEPIAETPAPKTKKTTKK